jgi:Tol biopolymer transport system component
MRMVCSARSVLISAVVICAVPCVLRGAPVKLNSALTVGGAVDTSFRISADSSRVLYVADQDTEHVFELYNVPIGGGSPVKLNGPLINGGDVVSGSPQFSPNGGRVLYVADQEVDQVTELYSVPSTGGATVKLNSPLPMSANVDGSNPIFSPDGSRVVYCADQQTALVHELYSVPSGGGANTKLNGVLVNGGDVDPLGTRFSPDGSRVLYVADQDTDEAPELYSVPAAGGTPLKLNGPLVLGGRVASASARFNANGTRVLYVADQYTNSVDELFSVAASGGTPVKLNGTLIAGGDVSLTSSLFSADGSRVVYRADQNLDNVFELYSVPSTGGISVKLNGSLVSAGDVVEDSARVSPDSTRVLYIADEDTNEKFELYNVPISAGTPNKLSGPLLSQGDVTAAEFTPDGSRVIYLANEDSVSAFELYSVPSAGGTPTKISGPLVYGGNVTDFQISPNGQRVVYRADADTDGMFELYSASLSASGVTGDYNGNGIVDAADYTVWRDTLGSTTDLRANGDNAGASAGKIDQADYTFWQLRFGNHASSGAADANATVPEPASAWLLFFAAMTLYRRRKKRC